MRFTPFHSVISSALILLAIGVAGCCTTGTGDSIDCCCAPAPSCSVGPVPHVHAEPVAPRWPGNMKGLVFHWSDGQPSNLKRWGKARINDAGIMELSGGALLPRGVDGRLLEACSRSNELSVEVVLMTRNEKQAGPARIVSFSTDTGQRNFTLGQERGQLVFRLRTSRNDLNGTNPQVMLCPIRKDRPLHVIVTYRRDELVCFVDGRQVLKTDKVKGDFSNWSPQQLIFGNEITKDRDWSGTIERLAIRSRALSDTDARQQFELMVAEMDRDQGNP